MPEKKKRWIIPELIVLLRGEEEEMSLAFCKTFGGFSGPNDAHWPCTLNGFCGSGCSQWAIS